MDKDVSREPPTMFSTRESLLLRLKEEGNESAWREFHSIYGRLIFGYSLHFDISYAEAEDIVQEVCIKVFRQIIRFNYSPEQGRFRGWLRTITRNTVIDYLRRKQHRQRHSRAYVHHVERELAAKAAEDEALWRAEWEKALFEAAMERVRLRVDAETYRVFVQYVLDDRAASDVANETTLDANAIYAVKHRVMRYLRQEIQNILDNE